MLRATVAGLLLGLCSLSTIAAAERKYTSIKTESAVAISHLKQGWVPMGISAIEGDEITFSAQGEVELGLAHAMQPKHLLWGRIGEQGRIFQFSSNAPSIVSNTSGQLFVAISPSGMLFANQQGEWIDALKQMPDADINVTVNAIIWKGPAEKGLRQLQTNGDAQRMSIAKTALASIANKKDLPVGFEYLSDLGHSNVFEAFAKDGRVGVHAQTDDDFGIIRKPVDIPLTENTQIDFSWLYQSIPAQGPETAAATHDYLSIAVEFDNGRDITWFWSNELPEGTGFECPLPEWVGREWHIALQSGTAGLGQWGSHNRQILQDYEKTIPGRAPKRIVAVWIITNAVFDRQPAEAYFADVVISNGEQRISIF